MSNEWEKKQKEMQEKLTAARKLLVEAGSLAQEIGVELEFMGLRYENSFGWFSYDGELQEPSEWNTSHCVIGSRLANGFGTEWMSSSESCYQW
jgi:hypothetical protein